MANGCIIRFFSKKSILKLCFPSLIRAPNCQYHLKRPSVLLTSQHCPYLLEKMESTEKAEHSKIDGSKNTSSPETISGSTGMVDGMVTDEPKVSLSSVEVVEVPEKEEEMTTEGALAFEERMETLDSCEKESGKLSVKQENQEDFEAEEQGSRMGISETSNGLSKVSFCVPNFFFGFINGKGGVTKKKIESETDTNIMIPLGSKDKNITITGPNQNEVLKAKGRLLSLMKVAKSKLSITHFLSIPLTDESFKNGFLKFKEEVLKELEDDKIDEKLFQKVNKLHLTIGVMICSDENELQAASAALQECREKIVKPLVGDSSPKLSMAGLGFFGKSPAKTRVLYAKVAVRDSDSLLQDLCSRIGSHFLSEGITKNERDGQVTVHATLMNLAYLRKKRPFDSTKIIEKFGDFEFGEGDMKRIDLSILHKVSENGYYQQADTIEIP